MHASDRQWVGLPWAPNGRTKQGVDCVGLVKLFIAETMGIETDPPESDAYDAAKTHIAKVPVPVADLKRGDVLFFARNETLHHVAVALGSGKILHATAAGSRIDNGVTLIERLGLKYVAAVSIDNVQELCTALAVRSLKEPVTIILGIGVAVAAAGTAYTLLNRPKIPKISADLGRYASKGRPLETMTSVEAPLPDALGRIFLAGNSVYQTRVDKHLEVANPALQRLNKVVVFAGAPVSSMSQFKVNGIEYFSRWHAYETNGVGWMQGFRWLGYNTSNVDEAVNGIFASWTKRFPSINTYTGDHAISVPVDIRASYDRNFPVYGFAGCAYIVFRFFDADKFEGMNVAARVSGRQLRQFDTNGFVVATRSENLAGADGVKTRFKLTDWDVKQINSLTVNGTPWGECLPGSQSGNVAHLNRTKGYLEFITPPPAAATIAVEYQYYPRVWTANPAMHLVYLLTEPIRGKGLPESKIDWASAVELRDYCDASVTWNSGNAGPVTSARYTSNYVIDVRKPLADHIRAVLDACHSYLFLSQGKFFMRPRKEGSSVFSFDETNILVGENRQSTFSSQLIDRADRNNRIHLFYHSEDTFNAETGVIRDHKPNQDEREPRIGNAGVADEVLKYLAVDNQSQAERLAEMILAEDVGVRWACEFKTTVKGLALEPGDIIDVTHSSRPSWDQKLFRIEDVGQDESDHIAIKAVEYVEGIYI